MKVVVSDQVWSGFLRRAKRHHPQEHIEAIWGIETVDGFRITALKRIRLTARTGGVMGELDYDHIEIARQKWEAEQQGYHFLGTVHTHPHANNDDSPTTDDHTSAIKDGERLMGILHLWKPKDSTRFEMRLSWWIPQRPFEFEILPE